MQIYAFFFNLLNFQGIQKKLEYIAETNFLSQNTYTLDFGKYNFEISFSSLYGSVFISIQEEKGHVFGFETDLSSGNNILKRGMPSLLLFTLLRYGSVK